MNQTLLNNLAQPVNQVAKAYEARTAQFDQARAAEAETQRQRDNDMLKVFEFAGDGRTEEARYYAQSKGLEIPDQIYSNSDFAKGLGLAGKIYGSDPTAAQKFTSAWMSSVGQDFATRLASAQQAAGVPINPEDRDYQRKIAFEKWKIDNQRPEPSISRFKAGQDAYNDVMRSGISTADEANASRQEAFKYWDMEYGNGGGAVSQGLSNTSIPVSGNYPLVDAGVPQAQMPSGLPQGSVMIGTVGGRPIYQAPTGERFIDDGNP